MKIISKFKDYYDYLQGVYGVDEKLVLDRTKFYKKLPYSLDGVVSTIHVGEWVVQGFWRKGEIYYADQVKQFANERTPGWSSGGYNPNDYWFITTSVYTWKCLKNPMDLGDKSPTWKEDYPILLEYIDNSSKKSIKYIKCPILKDYKVNKILPGKQVWLLLSEWLGKQITKKEPVVPVGDDKVRIISAGFDIKKSFRH